MERCHVTNNDILVEELKRDIEKWECQELEFKKTATSDHEIAQAIAGFATSNIGRIYIGVDNGKITGLPNASSGLERDKYQQKIAQILRDMINPQIRVKLSFIEVESMVVVRIDVPKGEEPVYYVDYRPYVHDLSTTRRLEPTELKELYNQYFASSLGQQTNKHSAEIIELLNQLSDTQVMYSGFMDQLIKPDIYQFKYDLGTTAKKLSNLSVSEFSKKMGIDSKLRELSSKLEDAEAHEFYIGMESVKEFETKLVPCVSIANLLIEQIKKNIPSAILPKFGDILSENIDLLKNEWAKSEKYLERGNIDKLQIAFRRFGYTFHRLGTLPDADKLGISDELKDTGEQLRNLSSTQKYFLTFHYGSTSSFDEIKKKIEPLFERLDKLR